MGAAALHLRSHRISTPSRVNRQIPPVPLAYSTVPVYYSVLFQSVLLSHTHIHTLPLKAATPTRAYFSASTSAHHTASCLRNQKFVLQFANRLVPLIRSLFYYA